MFYKDHYRALQNEFKGNKGKVLLKLNKETDEEALTTAGLENCLSAYTTQCHNNGEMGWM